MGDGAASGEANPRAVQPFTWRGLCVGVAALWVNVHLCFRAEEMRQVWLSNSSPFANVIFLLFLLTGLNALVRRLAPRVALPATDLLAIYVMLSVQTGLGSAHCLHWLMGSITWGPWVDLQKTRSVGEWLVHMPDWLLVRDAEALRGYYLGQSSFFRPENLRAWAAPVVVWTILFWTLGAVLTAVAGLFTEQWSRKERLSYPVVELPFQMTAGGDAFWRSRTMWLGFGLAATGELVNGLNYLYPAVPQLPLRRIRLDQMWTDPPWNALGETNLSFYPFIIGLCYLIPLDLSFSLWFFYLLHKVQLVGGAMIGWKEIPNYPFTRDQQFGAAVAIVAMALWSGRDHLSRAWRLAWSGAAAGASPDAAAEVRTWRQRFVVLGVGSIIAPSFLMAAGLPGWMAFAVYAGYVLMGLVVGRIRCELGFPMHELLRMNGPNLLLVTGGAEALGARNVSLLGLFNSFTLANQNHILPHQLEGFRLADRAGLASNSLARGIGVAILVAVPLTFVAYLDQTYRYGASSAHIRLGQSGMYMWQSILPAWSHSEVYRGPNGLSLLVMAGSFLFAWSLMVLRLRWVGCPFHPLGLALADSGSGVGDVSCAVFVAFVCKAVTLHLGGLRAYRGALPFFLGLMLGDLVVGMGWTVWGILLDRPAYVFFL